MQNISGLDGLYDPKLREDIEAQFERIKQEMGFEPDENYEKELEEMLGLSFEEMEKNN
jgi:hypothetical protein